MRFLGAALKALALLALTTPAASAPSIQKRQNETDHHWVPTWTSMPQLVEPANLPPAPFVRLAAPRKDPL
ncbi:hypothetical protein IMZ48_20795 [Candidatus Bathyarchaeota archaeon]|nr:hypothetical protein [Candidatus Bathyarchaeota archaeon]